MRQASHDSIISIPVGRVLRSSTASLTLGTKTLAADVPRFGGFVKVAAPDGGDIIGLIYDVVIEDDLFARQLIGAEVSAEYIADQRAESPGADRDQRARRRACARRQDVSVSARAAAHLAR